MPLRPNIVTVCPILHAGGDSVCVRVCVRVCACVRTCARPPAHDGVCVLCSYIFFFFFISLITNDVTRNRRPVTGGYTVTMAIRP